MFRGEIYFFRFSNKNSTWLGLVKKATWLVLVRKATWLGLVTRATWLGLCKYNSS